MAEITLAVAFIAGIISFLSPCVLPLIPGFLAYLSGTSLEKITKEAKVKIFINSVFFVLGFSLVFAALGVLLNTVLDEVSYSVQTWLARLAGIIIILFGLNLIGLLKIAFLEREHKFKVLGLQRSYLTSSLFGAAFAVGWTPCVGAVLGSVLALAVSQPASSFFLLLSYSLGLGIPFLLVGIFTGQALRLIRKSGNFLKYFNIVVGIILILLGVLVFTLKLPLIANLGFVNRLLLR
ncbi:MAG TPA: cytochrome c biogenesis protein CcdA [Candidatus Nanoarchaeia archaeon]|nr:cytochrome c biogenesis protein CcdA [Candidatus Nanoarchaeia archaeon]